jgi:hypothetical protein
VAAKEQETIGECAGRSQREKTGGGGDGGKELSAVYIIIL